MGDIYIWIEQLTVMSYRYFKLNKLWNFMLKLFFPLELNGNWEFGYIYKLIADINLEPSYWNFSLSLQTHQIREHFEPSNL